jgi:GTP-binding protein
LASHGCHSVEMTEVTESSGYVFMLYHRATFLTSCAKLGQLPGDTGYEVAFAGRSNAGKSSALNRITRQKGLAKTSKTPGRTQLINLFTLDEERRLVDLPGYGYAKVPLAVKQRWQKTLADYLLQRKCLRGLIVLMDIRHPLQPLDSNMIAWANNHGLPTHILLTKADKLKRGPAMNVLQKVQQQANQDFDQVSIQLFSSVTGQGLEQVYTVLNDWFMITRA